ncbi:transglycosylase domain-containing protein [Streptomyces fragilis]|uniref:Transglycosylase domain-containing protein n=1 Tax=Streptomyces fragilis TaxID=67301 RepID=A0ABV2YEM0_9ACTN|nr:transglycosylase domain-containing protein [Streptomyces fragilis]
MGRADLRHARRPRGIRRFFTWRKLLGTFLGVCLLGIGSLIALYLLVDVPDEGNALAQSQSNIYRYSNGKVLAQRGEVNRDVVDIDVVPEPVQHAFVAAENKTFYKDPGVDIKGTLRGLLNTARGKGKQGGSTITQQYVKNYYLTQDQTVTRKMREVVIALKVDRQMTKDQILAGYLNTSYYGRGAYGIQAAAQAYYRVDAKDLTVQQGAYLAALLQAPNQYDWAIASRTGKRLAEERWNYALDNMVEMKWLGASDRAGMKFPVPKEPRPAAGLQGQAGYLVQLANKELQQQLMETQGITAAEAEAKVEGQGWDVTLNVDPKKQQALEKAVKRQLTGKLDPEQRKVDAVVQAGAVSVDPRTGRIVALYGGQDYLEHYFSNATRTDFQIASTFKPLIFAAALERGATTQDAQQITANTVYDGTSRRPVVGSDIPFAPPNEDEVDYGPVTVQTAMNKSVNSVFAQMGVDVGMDDVLETADRMGVDTDKLDPLPAYTLGSMDASPLQMAGAYATLARHGLQVTPTLVKKAEQGGTTVDMPDAVGDRILTRNTADTVTSVLTGVVDDGTARTSVRDNPARAGQQVAGKTGTSDGNKSAWFVGYTPDLVTAVGMFGEHPKSHRHVSLSGATGLIPGKGRINGGGYPAQIWADYTFGVTDGSARFDLRTDQGAAIAPTPTQTPSPTPSETPTETPSPTPSETVTETPTGTPTTEAPSESGRPTEEETTTDPRPGRPTDDAEAPAAGDDLDVLR